MFATPMSAPQMTYGYVSAPAVYGDVSATYGQQFSNVQYAQPVVYAEPEAVDQGSWGFSAGFSDVALLAIAGATLGVVVGRQSATSTSTDEEEIDLEVPRAVVAALAVGGAETTADLETLAKGLNPVVGFWDPLNLSEAEFYEQSNEATIGFLRHAEIKHGRVAMAGFVGYCIHANGIHFPWKIPGDELCAPGVSPTELWQNIPYEAKLQIILGVGFLEWWSELRLIPGEAHYMKGGKPGYVPPFDATPDDLPHWIGLNLYDPFKLSAKKTEEQKARGLLVELNNGRLAMLGLMAFLSEGKIPGSVPFLKGVIPALPYDVMAPAYLDFSGGVAF
jgi:hypothetical protein